MPLNNLSKTTTERFVTESTKPNYVTINDQFTIDIAAEEPGQQQGGKRSLCFPIVKDGDPVLWYDLDSLEDYAQLLEDALKVAAMEIAALRLVHEKPTLNAS